MAKVDIKHQSINSINPLNRMDVFVLNILTYLAFISNFEITSFDYILKINNSKKKQIRY